MTEELMEGSRPTTQEVKEEQNEDIQIEQKGDITAVQRIIGGRMLRIETGELAKQASGSVVVTYGDTVVLCSSTISKQPREGIDFFPLIIDFEEKMYAAGKMPGGFFKREGRPTEKAIISARQIDRPIRPLFPEGMRHEVQVICTVLSADIENDPDIIGMIGASAALSISGIPFNGPIGGVRIGIIDNEYVVNPTLQQLIDSQINLVIAGTKTDIMMVEAAAEEIDEEQILKALELGHSAIKKIVEMIEVLKEKVGKEPIEIEIKKPAVELEQFVKEQFSETIAKGMRIFDKQERMDALSEINVEKAINILASKIKGEDVNKEEENLVVKKILKNIDEMGLQNTEEKLLEILVNGKSQDFKKVVKKLEEEELRKMVVDEKLRPDGRKVDEIRPLSGRVSLLPRTHGSGLFTRGQTQVLSNLTLAPLSEGQEVDGLGIEESKRYMHQYNFPPYSVGETRPVRGPGRREIGHGHLAERALLPMIPDEDEFPYAIRIVSEVLESNGSSSMASVCASTMALMDSGVPLKKPVAGIAMGLILKDNNYTVLTDIQGLEDALGEMDFKVAGTRDGINALQMDIKVQGISIEIMKTALEQARKARFFILDMIESIIPEPRAELSPYAPRIFTMIINPEKIREVIGQGGKNINRIIDETGCKIDIENDGTIFICTNNLEMAEKAQSMIEGLISEPEVGEIYQGKVVRIADFGAFVELKPGKDGMIRSIDLVPRGKKVSDAVSIGDHITVEIAEIDNLGRINLKIPGVPRQTPEPRRGGGHRGDRRGGGKRW